MTSSSVLHEDDLVHAAKLAGITVTPEFRRGILERLTELREGVFRFADAIGEDAIPAVRFSAE
jgi:hypothetical protein